MPKRKKKNKKAKDNPLIYIAGDDGKYYRIEGKKLKKKTFQVPPDDPNLEIIDFLFATGTTAVSMSSREAKKIQKDPRYAHFGMFVGVDDTNSTHFLNLATATESKKLEQKKKGKK